MPARISLPIAALLALAGPALAEGPGYADAARHDAPRRLAHRPYPRPDAYRGPGYDPYARRRAYGPVVRAYLPRNDSLPMYNEPPAR